MRQKSYHDKVKAPENLKLVIMCTWRCPQPKVYNDSE
jgi:hypothetical protein